MRAVHKDRTRSFAIDGISEFGMLNSRRFVVNGIYFCIPHPDDFFGTIWQIITINLYSIGDLFALGGGFWLQIQRNWLVKRNYTWKGANGSGAIFTVAEEPEVATNKLSG